jgi:ketosteroid isomerase-like protein
MALPGASAGAQQTTANANISPAFREMQQVEDRWATAVTKRDQYTLELVLAPQYIGISATGDVTTRNQQIAHLFVKNAGPDSLQQKVISARFVGDIAIVNGTYVMTWKGDKGPVLEKGIFSHVFERVRDNWLCLNSQRTVVAEENKAEASKDKSPLHLPHIYKGPDTTQPR